MAIYTGIFQFSKTPATISFIVAFVTITPLTGVVDDSFLINNSKSPIAWRNTSSRVNEGILKRGKTCLNVIYRL